MSILTAPLAEHVEINGVCYPVHTDFRNWIQIGSIMSRSEKEIGIRLAEAFKLCYQRNALPPSLEAAAYAMIQFYAGDLLPVQSADSVPKDRKPVYDFEYDAEYIFSAFWAQYGLDLTESRLHWHKFKALFMGLGEDNKICRIIEYRSMDLSKIKSKEQKAFYRKMQRIYRLPDMRTQAEKEAEMMNLIAKGF